MVCIANQLACALSAEAGFLSAVAPLLIKVTVFLLSQHRQVPESSFTILVVPLLFVRSLKLLIWTLSFRFSVAWVQAYLLRLPLR